MSEPLTLAFVKQVLRVDAGDGSQDDYLNHLIVTAREAAESRTTRGYLRQTFREYYDYFPGTHFPLPVFADGLEYAIFARRGHHRHRHHHYFELSRSPLQFISQIQYKDPDGVVQTLDPTQYVVNDKEDPAQVDKAPGICWPRPLCERNCIWIDYTVGYGADISVGATSGSPTLSGYTFASQDAGSAISIPGAGVAGATLLSRIAAVVSGVGTLADNAVTAVTAAAAYLGNPVPSVAKQAMQLMINHWYENRLPVVPGTMIEVPYAIEDLLLKNKVYYQP